MPKSGGILKYPSTIYPTGFDPHRRPSYLPFASIPVFNNLVRYDPTKAETSPATIQGDLAERWTFTPDGKSWTFNLRRGVKWHDGQPFTADDVIYNLDKLADPKRSLQAGAFPAYQRSEKVNDLTVKVYLSRPQPSFLANLAGGYSVFVAPQAGDKFQSTDFLIGTGPFKFKSYTSGVSLSFVKNTEYFKKGLPYLDGVNYYIIVDRSAQTDALITKRIDMTNALSGIANKETLDRIASQAPEVHVAWGRQNPQVIWFNTKRKPLDDVRVRKALALVTDMKAAVIGGFGAENFRDPTVAIMPPAYGLPRSEVEKILGWDKPMDQRLAEAKALLKEAGLEGGFKLEYVCWTVPELSRFAQVIADYYRRTLNVDVKLTPLPYAEADKRKKAGEYDIYADGLSTMVNDPDEVVGDFKTGSPSNFAFWSNAEVDRLATAQSVETDLSKRVQICQQIERLILSEVPVIPQGALPLASGWQPYVKGFVMQNVAYGSGQRFEYVWLDK
ncbi:MAG: ABC transporter substrate-binding protein [Dehalococcoidia bacterium]|nr:ABC transporter substrate-binding protein [Dehalococcoidia bacterium]